MFDRAGPKQFRSLLVCGFGLVCLPFSVFSSTSLSFEHIGDVADGGIFEVLQPSHGQDMEESRLFVSGMK